MKITAILQQPARLAALKRLLMLDWLTWPADLLLNAGAAVAGLFFGADEPNFVVVQMMVATLILAAIVSLMVFWRGLVEFCRARWKDLRTRAHRSRDLPPAQRQCHAARARLSPDPPRFAYDPISNIVRTVSTGHVMIIRAFATTTSVLPGRAARRLRRPELLIPRRRRPRLRFRRRSQQDVARYYDRPAMPRPSIRSILSPACRASFRRSAIPTANSSRRARRCSPSSRSRTSSKWTRRRLR